MWPFPLYSRLLLRLPLRLPLLLLSLPAAIPESDKVQVETQTPDVKVRWKALTHNAKTFSLTLLLS